MNFNELLEYLTALSKVQGAGHYVNEEIKEVIRVLRIELGLDKFKKESLKESLRLVYEAKLGGKTTFRQHCLFEAAFGHEDKEIKVLYQVHELADVLKAIEVLRGMCKEISIVHIESLCTVLITRL